MRSFRNLCLPTVVELYRPLSCRASLASQRLSQVAVLGEPRYVSRLFLLLFAETAPLDTRCNYQPLRPLYNSLRIPVCGDSYREALDISYAKLVLSYLRLYYAGRQQVRLSNTQPPTFSLLLASRRRASLLLFSLSRLQCCFCQGYKHWPYYPFRYLARPSLVCLLLSQALLGPLSFGVALLDSVLPPTRTLFPNRSRRLVTLLQLGLYSLVPCSVAPPFSTLYPELRRAYYYSLLQLPRCNTYLRVCISYFYCKSSCLYLKRFGLLARHVKSDHHAL